MTTSTYAKTLAKIESEAAKTNAANATERARIEAAIREAEKTLRDANGTRTAQAATLRDGGKIEADVWVTTGATLDMARTTITGRQAALKRIRDVHTDRRLADAVADLLRQELIGLGIQVISTSANLYTNAANQPTEPGTIVVEQRHATGYTDAGRMANGRGTGSIRLYWLHTVMHRGLDAEALSKAASAKGMRLELSDDNRGMNAARDSDGLIMQTYSALVEMEPTCAPELEAVPTAEAVNLEVPTALERFRQKLTGHIDPVQRSRFRFGFYPCQVELRDTNVEPDGTVRSKLELTAVLMLQRDTEGSGKYVPVDLRTSTIDGPALDAGISEAKLTASDVRGSLFGFAGICTSATGLKVERPEIPTGRRDGDKMQVLAITAGIETEAYVSTETLAAHHGMSVLEWLEELALEAELDELDQAEELA